MLTAVLFSISFLKEDVREDSERADSFPTFFQRLTANNWDCFPKLTHLVRKHATSLSNFYFSSNSMNAYPLSFFIFALSLMLFLLETSHKFAFHRLFLNDFELAESAFLKSNTFIFCCFFYFFFFLFLYKEWWIQDHYYLSSTSAFSNQTFFFELGIQQVTVSGLQIWTVACLLEK